MIFDHRDGAFVVRCSGEVLKRFHVPKRKQENSDFVNIAEYKERMKMTRALADQWVLEHSLKFE